MENKTLALLEAIYDSNLTYTQKTEGADQVIYQYLVENEPKIAEAYDRIINRN